MNKTLSICLHVGILVALVIAVYFARLGYLTVRGEESRRATVGMEMTATGDWIVPRQQGNPIFMSARPPLQSWAMAGFGILRGKLDAVAVRLPSAIAILLITLLVYGYGRTFLSPAAAFAAAAAYATMGQVMELGRLGETDAMFTLFVSGSLLLWHWGFSRQWNPFITWGLAWLCVALATLTKGPQAPVYFILSIGVYLLVTRRWRLAFSLSNLLGVLVFLVVWGSWQLPYYLQMGLAGTRHIYTGDVAMYMDTSRFLPILKHYATYPFETLGCLLPWSIFLAALALRDVRKGVRANPNFLFLIVCLVVTFPTVWLIPSSHTRFYMPLYPCLAVIVGLVIDECTRHEAGRIFWRVVIAGFAIFIAATGVVVLAASIFRPQTPCVGQPIAFAITVAVLAAVLALVVWWAQRTPSSLRVTAGVLCIALFAGLLYAGMFVNFLAAKSEHAAEAVAELKTKLPGDVNLVSYGPIHHLFAFHYGKPIRLLPAPAKASANDGVTYFCTMDKPPFAYEEVARIICDRNRTAKPEGVVLVGRRILAAQSKP